MGHGRKCGEKDSHPIPLWNGIFEHYDRIGDALWEFAWRIDRITKEHDGVGIVLGGAPVRLRDVVAALHGSKKETVRRHMQGLDEAGYIRRRRTPYGYVIEVPNSLKFGIWKKENSQNNVSLPREKHIYEPETRIGGVQKPKRNRNKEDSAGTQQKDSAAAGSVWAETGVAPNSVPGPFRKLCEKLWLARDGASLFDFMGRVLDAWCAQGSSKYPPAWVRRKSEIGHFASSSLEQKRPELECIPWQK